MPCHCKLCYLKPFDFLSMRDSKISETNALLSRVGKTAFGRREFLKLSGLGLFGAMVPSLSGCSGSPGHAAPGLSLQLYTIRDELERDTPGSLSRLADIGYTYVETAFWPDGSTHEQAAELLRRAGLKVSSSHVEMPENGDMSYLLDLARLYNTDMMIWHGWPEDPRYGSLAGTRELIAEYNEVCAFLRNNGLRFGLHNHWWEFMQRPDNRIAYQVLHEEMDPDIFFQIDTYWVQTAGLDPAAVIRELGNRVRSLHIKDGAAEYFEGIGEEPHPPMSPVGQGTLDFGAIARAAESYVEWNVIEADEVAGDPFRLLDESLQYMVSNGYAEIR